MSRIDPDHRTTSFFGFVLNEGPDLVERPAMQATGLLSVSGLDPASDIGQVLKADGPTQRCGGDDLFRKDVVTVAPESSLCPSGLLEAALCRLRRLSLEGPALFETSGLIGPPTLLSQEVIVAGDSRLRETQIDPDYVVGRDAFGRRQRDDDVQPPDTITADQVSRRDFSVNVPGGVSAHSEGNLLPTAGRRESRDTSYPIDLYSVDVVPRRTGERVRLANLSPLLLEGEHRPDRFRRLHPCLNVKIGHERRVLGLEQSIGRVVQCDPVFFAIFPTMSSYSVEGERE